MNLRYAVLEPIDERGDDEYREVRYLDGCLPQARARAELFGTSVIDLTTGKVVYASTK